MLNIGMTELLVFGIIALLVLGPDKLPEAVRFAGKWYGKLKRMISNVQNDIDRELRLSELREQMQNEMQRIQDLEQKMQAQMQHLQQQTHVAHNQTEKTAISDNKNSSPIYFYLDEQQQPKNWLKKQSTSIFNHAENSVLTRRQSSLPLLQEAV